MSWSFSTLEITRDCEGETIFLVCLPNYMVRSILIFVEVKILFIQTGGTIDKDYPHMKGGWAFEIADAAVESVLNQLNPSFEYAIHSFSKKDSLEMTLDDRRKLSSFIAGRREDKIIITHGTDTILDTAKSLTHLSEKTIVLTGAMRPAKFVDSDAKINIGMAISGVQLLSSGVYVCMHGIIGPEMKFTRDPNGKFVVK